MSITTHQIKTYTIDDHPNPEAVYDWIRGNWHDLGQFDVEEFVDSFKALAEHLGVRCDYSVCIHPDRGEVLSLEEFDAERLAELNEDDYPLTGVCWDYTFIKALKEDDLQEALVQLHKQGDYLYSDDGLREHIEANEYEFLENGEFYP